MKASIVLELIEKVREPARKARAALASVTEETEEARQKMAAVKKVRADSAFNKTARSASSLASATHDVTSAETRYQRVQRETLTSIKDQLYATSQLSRARERLSRIRAAGGSVYRTTRNAAFAGMAYAGIGTGVVSKFSATAGAYEDQLATLKTLEGGNLAKAKENFAWIENFAMKTPYELGQVNEAFIKLRSYGIDPIKSDTLRILGDTAAGMGKDVNDAVEAIADAAMGENERLKEFGIKASVVKGMIEYRFADRDGKQQVLKANKDNQEEIKATILSIMNSKYQGAMDERSKTWNGMLSNMSDHWSKFQNTVMQSGAMDYMKDQLQVALAYIQWWTERGDIKRWARQLSDGFINFVRQVKVAAVAIWSFGKRVYSTIDKVAQFVGGWDNLLIGIAGFVILGSVASTFVAISSALAITASAALFLTKVAGGLKVAFVAIRALKMVGLFSAMATSIGFAAAKTIALKVAQSSLRGAMAAGAMAAGAGRKTYHLLGKGLMFLGTKALPLVLTGIRAIGIAAMANPIGLTIMAIAGGAYLIYRNWDKIHKWWTTTTWTQKAIDVSMMLSPLGMFKASAKTTWSWWKGTSWGKKSIELGTSALDKAKAKGMEILTFFVTLPVRLAKAGTDAIQGFVNGMFKVDLAGAAKGVTDKVVGSVKSMLGIKSPSRVFMGIGADTVAGLRVGLTDNAGQAVNAVSGIAAAMSEVPMTTPAANMPRFHRPNLLDFPRTASVAKLPVGMTAGGGQQAHTVHNEAPITINITVNGGGDAASTGREVAKEVEKALRQMQRRGAVKGRSAMHDGSAS